jgi:hypothetical protein
MALRLAEGHQQPRIALLSTPPCRFSGAAGEVHDAGPNVKPMAAD